MNQMGFCFVERDDWEEWLRINPDIPDDAEYGTWLSNIAEFCEAIENQGRRAIKVTVKPAEFLAWCKHNGHQINSGSRSHYAAVRLGVGEE